MKKTKICFISPSSYPLFDRDSEEYFGGAEVQISLIAKTLAEYPQFKIYLIAGDYGQKEKIRKSGLWLVNELYRAVIR